jgi:hypothetical protein
MIEMVHVLSCPGRAAAFFMPLRRAGTQPLERLQQYGSRLCSAPLRKSFALRCVRDTESGHD